MRILPGLAYNDMKRILPGLTNNDMKLPLAGFSSMAGKNAPAAVRGSFPPDFPMYKEVSIPRLLPGGSS